LKLQVNDTAQYAKKSQLESWPICIIFVAGAGDALDRNNEFPFLEELLFIPILENLGAEESNERLFLFKTVTV
jgi:hypothetical protein